MRTWKSTAFALLVACSGGDSGGGCNGGGGGPIEFGDENNYAFSGSLELSTVTVGASDGEGYDLTIDWSGVTTDLRGRPLDPSTVTTVAFSQFLLSPDEVEDLIETNDLLIADTEDYYTFENQAGVTSQPLSVFEITGQVVDPETQITVIDGIRAISLFDEKSQALMSVFVDAVADDENREVALDDQSGTFTVLDIDIAGRKPLTVKEGESEYPLDWSGLKNDVYANPFDPLQSNLVTVAHYDGSVADLEADFLLLDDLATESYQLVTTDTAAELTEAVDANLDPFEGFTAKGTWIVYISCPECLNPAPTALAWVQVEE